MSAEWLGRFAARGLNGSQKWLISPSLPADLKLESLLKEIADVKSWTLCQHETWINSRNVHNLEIEILSRLKGVQQISFRINKVVCGMLCKCAAHLNASLAHPRRNQIAPICTLCQIIKTIAIRYSSGDVFLSSWCQKISWFRRSTTQKANLDEKENRWMVFLEKSAGDSLRDVAQFNSWGHKYPKCSHLLPKILTWRERIVSDFQLLDSLKCLNCTHLPIYWFCFEKPNIILSIQLFLAVLGKLFHVLHATWYWLVINIECRTQFFSLEWEF